MKVIKGFNRMKNIIFLFFIFIISIQDAYSKKIVAPKDCVNCQDRSSNFLENTPFRTLAVIDNSLLDTFTCEDILKIKFKDESNGKTYKSNEWQGSISYYITPKYSKYYKIKGYENFYFVEVPSYENESTVKGNYAVFYVERDENSKEVKSVKNYLVRYKELPNYVPSEKIFCEMNELCLQLQNDLKVNEDKASIYKNYSKLAVNKMAKEILNYLTEKQDNFLQKEGTKNLIQPLKDEFIKIAQSSSLSMEVKSPDDLVSLFDSSLKKIIGGVCSECTEFSIKNFWPKIEKLKEQGNLKERDNLLDIRDLYMLLYNFLDNFKQDAYIAAVSENCKSDKVLSGFESYCTSLNRYLKAISCIRPDSIEYFKFKNQKTKGSALLEPLELKDIF